MIEPSAPHDVTQQVRAHYDHMSKSQQRVAEFLIDHTMEAAYLSAARIAQVVEVSHSTVVRTAQALGFAGFPELQVALQEQFLGRMNATAVFQLGAYKLVNELHEQQSDLSTGAILQRVMLTDARNIENLIPQIPVADFERAVDWLCAAEHVYVLGLRSSGPLALNFGLGLRQIRPNCTVMQPTNGDLVDQSAQIKQGDVLFAICFSRYMRETLRCMEVARAAGAQVITFTDSPLSPAAKRADLAFVVRYGVWFYGASAAVMSALNALIAVILLRQRELADQRLARVDQIIERFSIFEPPVTGE